MWFNLIGYWCVRPKVWDSKERLFCVLSIWCTGLLSFLKVPFVQFFVFWRISHPSFVHFKSFFNILHCCFSLKKKMFSSSRDMDLVKGPARIFWRHTLCMQRCWICSGLNLLYPITLLFTVCRILNDIGLVLLEM